MPGPSSGERRDGANPKGGHSVRIVERFVEVADRVSLRTLRYTPEPSGVAVAETGRPTFVLVHGLASNALLWRGVALALAERGEHAISVDLRGHGQSSKPDGPYDMATVAHDLRLVIETLELDRPVVAGQSWGGNVVIELAANNPGLTRGVVPVDGGFIELSSQFETWAACEAQLAPPKFAGTKRSTFEGWMRSSHPDWSDQAIEGVMGNVEVATDDTIAPWLSFENHISVLHGLFAHAPTDCYPIISDPVWWMVAGSPELTDPTGTWSGNKTTAIDAALASLRKSRATWFAGGDHDLHAQYPDHIADLLVSGINEGWFS